MDQLPPLAFSLQPLAFSLCFRFARGAKTCKLAATHRDAVRRRLTVLNLACLVSVSAVAATDRGVPEFSRDVRPILEEFCFDCHADGAHKGGVAFDELKPDRNFADSRE